MMKSPRHLPALALLLCLAPAWAQAAASAKVSFMYKLSDFSGPVPSLWARVDVDPRLGEVYTLNIGEGLIQIFNNSAMQLYGTGEDYNLQSAVDIAVGEDGESFVLFGRFPGREILKLDYDGKLLKEIGLSGLPDALLPFHPTYIDYRDGTLYLADAQSLRIVAATPEGEFLEGHDIKARIQSGILEELQEEGLRASRREKLKEDLEALANIAFGGFDAGVDGAFYFTIPTFFTAYRLTPDGEMRGFGTSGGAPGKFGVIAGIAADAAGHIYVADRLRSVVLVFDREFNWLTDFGYRGAGDHNLIVPDDIAHDGRTGQVYVAQAANEGVSVFSVKFE